MKPDNTPAISKQKSTEAGKFAVKGKPSKSPSKLRITPPAFKNSSKKFKQVLEDSSEKALLTKPEIEKIENNDANPKIIERVKNIAAKTLLFASNKDKKETDKSPEKVNATASYNNNTKKAEQNKNTNDESVVTKVYTVKRNDTLSSIFKKVGYSQNLSRKIAVSLVRNANFKVTNLKVGQKLIFTEETSGKEKKLVKFQVPYGAKTITINNIDKLENYEVTKKTEKTEGKYFYKKGEIKSNITNLASRLKLPSKVRNSITKIISNKLDANREIKKGDALEVLYEQVRNSRGKIIDSGKILYIGLQKGLYKIEAFRFSKTGDGRNVDYYDVSAYSFKKSISSRPIAGRSRISSNFGYRKHPILKKSMMHTGTDYAAKRGTPVTAAGSGTIVKLGRYGGYGKYIKIKHDAVWQTAYAHLNGYKRGLRNGSRVKKGQVIGYVGSTGRSSGPHLHFEVLKYGRAVNPRTAKLPKSNRLYGKHYKNYKYSVSKIRNILNAQKAEMYRNNAPIPMEKPKRK